MTNTNDGQPTLLSKAMAYQHAGDLVNAEIYFNQATEEPSLAADAHSNLGMLHVMKGDPQKAINHWSQALQIDANHLESLTNLGYSISQLGNYPKALEYLEAAYIIAPKRSDIALQIGQLRFETGDTQAAIDILEQLIRSEADNQNAYMMLAQIKASQQDFIGAEKHLTDLIDKQPKLPEPWINLAHLSEANGDINKAKELYVKAVELMPFHFLANLEYGRFLSNNGQNEKGLEFLNKAAQIQPNDWSLFVHIGNAKQELGDFEGAIIALRKAIELNPNDVGTKQNLSRILSRFVPPWHLKMLADHERNEAFDQAIRKAVTKESTVLDIGTGSGILSMMAARQGAKFVYTCEQSKYIADAAKQNIKKNGYQDKIKVFESKSTQLKQADFSDSPDIIVAEIFDAGLLGEHAIPSFRHALNHLTKPNCKIIPQSAVVKGRLIHTEKLASVNPINSISGLDLSAFDQFRVPDEYTMQHLSEISHNFCSDEFQILDVNFTKLWDPLALNQYKRYEVQVPVTSNSPIHGVAFWFDLHLDNEIILSGEPARTDNHWGQALAFFPNPLRLKQDDPFKLAICHTDTKIWFEPA